MSGLPFAYDYVPARDIFPGGFFEPAWWGVLPCMLLPALISIGYGLWLKRAILPQWYSACAYVFAAMSVCSFFASTLLEFSFDGFGVIFFPIIFLVAFCAAAGLVIPGLAHARSLAGLAAMQAAFVVQIQFWLGLAAGEFQAGAWCATAAAIAYVGQIALISRRRAWLLSLLLAPALVSAVMILVQT